LRIAFIHSQKPRERLLGSAFVDGARVHGDEAWLVEKIEGMPLLVEGADVVCLVGVKSRELIQAHWNAGIHTIYFDKGYCRGKGAGPVGWEYWRVAVDAHHPTRYLMRESRSPARWEALGVDVLPWRPSGRHILIAGSSAKYHDFYGLSGPAEYYTKLTKRLNKLTGRPIVYRPKPSYREAEPILGTRFSTSAESIADVLRDCHALVTHGSNAVFEALIAGVPSIVLGEAVTKPISSTDIAEIEAPVLASDQARMQLLANLAWHQWTMPELASGEAWGVTRPFIYG